MEGRWAPRLYTLCVVRHTLPSVTEPLTDRRRRRWREYHDAGRRRRRRGGRRRGRRRGARRSILHFRSKAFHVASRLSIRLRFAWSSLATRLPREAFSSRAKSKWWSLLPDRGRATAKGQWRSNGVSRAGKVQEAPECRDPRVPGEIWKKRFFVIAKIRTSGYRTLECFIATLPTEKVFGCFVHVGETFNRPADFGLWIAQKIR